MELSWWLRIGDGVAEKLTIVPQHSDSTISYYARQARGPIERGVKKGESKTNGAIGYPLVITILPAALGCVSDIDTEFAQRHGNYGSQLWVNILAHEVFWHGTKEHADTGQDGDISGIIGNPNNTPFTVSEDSKKAIIKDLGF